MTNRYGVIPQGQYQKEPANSLQATNCCLAVVVGEQGLSSWVSVDLAAWSDGQGVPEAVEKVVEAEERMSYLSLYSKSFHHWFPHCNVSARRQ